MAENKINSDIYAIDDDGDVLYDDDDEVVIVGKFKNGTPLIF